MKILSVGVVSKSVTIIDISEQVFCVGVVSKCIDYKILISKVERCLREGETCNIASAGYDSTVCRCVIFFYSK